MSVLCLHKDAGEGKGWKPATLQAPILCTFVLVSLSVIALLEFLYYKSAREGNGGALVFASDSKSLPMLATFGYGIIHRHNCCALTSTKLSVFADHFGCVLQHGVEVRAENTYKRHVLTGAIVGWILMSSDWNRGSSFLSQMAPERKIRFVSNILLISCPLFLSKP